MSRLFWKALLAFLVLPGTFAFLVPLTLFVPSWRGVGMDPLGLVPLLLGMAALLATVREFYVAGRGTLAPWSPPRELVTTGLYRFSRNPMYVAVVMILFGWSALFHSGELLVYALAVAAGFHLRVVFGEEPWLKRTHGESWVRYQARVPRWFFGFRSNNREVTP
ncbi:MAG TPA: isoprenylcysteine carboxylmethyltransferase family protein [Gammaproteobacteria bacterium]|nr:isoprenylcysteine carboxylmethyltransferase family protein [Gammaproteobacteria bacterium]